MTDPDPQETSDENRPRVEEPDQKRSGHPARTPASGYSVRIPGFEGPLDLLLTLAHQGKVDLSTIPLADLSRQFTERMRNSMDLTEATEALWMLAALVEMKAKLLLPKAPPPEALPLPEEGGMPETVEEKVAEYRAFKEAASALRALEDEQKRIFTRSARPTEPELPLEGLTVEDLFAAFGLVLERARRQQAAEVADEPVRVADRKVAILRALVRSGEGLEFSDLFPLRVTVVFVVVTFLALLELVGEHKVRLRQESAFSPIFVWAAG